MAPEIAEPGELEKRGDDDAPPPSASQPPASFFARFGDLGVCAQAAVPGLYAWAVTVLTVAWGRGAGLAPKLTAMIALLVLIGAALLELKNARVARLLSVWGFSAACALTWGLASPSASHLDAARGVTGMIGWGLFAYASAAPALGATGAPRTSEGPASVRDPSRLTPRTKLDRGDGAYLAGGAVLALMLQLVGWRSVVPEREILVRLALLAAGLAVLGTATTIGLARHARGSRAASRKRRRPAVLFTLAIVLLLAVGVVVHLAGAAAP